MLSAPSNAAKATTLTAGSEPEKSQNGGPPTNPTTDPTNTSVIQTLTAKSISANEIELRWAIPGLIHVASLRIFRASSEDPKNFVMIGAIGANLSRYVDMDLKPKTTYYYHIRYNESSHSAILSAPSNVASATTPDGADPNPRRRYEGLRPKAGILYELPAGGIGSAIPLDDQETELLYLLNQYRASKGLGPVRASIALTMSGDALARDLAPRNEISKNDSNGFGTFMRARAFGFPKLEETKFDTLTLVSRFVDVESFFNFTISYSENAEMLLRPEWKVVGIGCSYNGEGSYHWVLDFADYWDKTIPLPGEDTDGRVDANERIRTRPPIDALAAKAKFSGYGDDGKPYSPVHCDQETKECWRDPAPAGNRYLRDNSYPENMIGRWHVEYQINSKGVTHFNSPDQFDVTEFAMSLLINEDGTWVSQGYKSYQDPVPAEAGTWKWVHDAGRGQEIITFFRDNGKAAATIRVHAAPGALTFFAVDGGDFFKGVAADSNPKDDPQVIFLPGAGFFYKPAPAFPAAMRCGSCPRTTP
ncbi:MAG: CAP domain-containing protein [Blastocatellia bacterium]